MAATVGLRAGFGAGFATATFATVGFAAFAVAAAAGFFAGARCAGVLDFEAAGFCGAVPAVTGLRAEAAFPVADFAAAVLPDAVAALAAAGLRTAVGFLAEADAAGCFAGSVALAAAAAVFRGVLVAAALVAVDFAEAGLAAAGFLAVVFDAGAPFARVRVVRPAADVRADRDRVADFFGPLDSFSILIFLRCNLPAPLASPADGRLFTQSVLDSENSAPQ